MKLKMLETEDKKEAGFHLAVDFDRNPYPFQIRDRSIVFFYFILYL